MIKIPVRHVKIFKRGSKDNPSYGIELPKRFIQSGKIDTNKLVNYDLEQE